LDAGAGGMIVVLIVFPHLIWLQASGTLALPDVPVLANLFGSAGPLVGWLRLLVVLIAAHGMLLVLIVVAGGIRASGRERAPVFERASVDPLAKTFVYLFALAPGLIATLLAAFWNEPAPLGGVAPHIVLSGLAIVVLAGDVIHLHRVRIVGVTWLALLLAPALVVIAGAALAPWVLAGGLSVKPPTHATRSVFTATLSPLTRP